MTTKTISIAAALAALLLNVACDDVAPGELEIVDRSDEETLTCQAPPAPTTATPVDAWVRLGEPFFVQGRAFAVTANGQPPQIGPEDLHPSLPRLQAGDVLGLRFKGKAQRYSILGFNADGSLLAVVEQDSGLANSYPSVAAGAFMFGVAVAGGQCFSDCRDAARECTALGGDYNCCAAHQFECNATCTLSWGAYSGSGTGAGQAWANDCKSDEDSGSPGDGGDMGDTDDCPDPPPVTGMLVTLANGDWCHYSGPVRSVPDNEGGCMDVINLEDGGHYYDCIPSLGDDTQDIPDTEAPGCF
ncbi:MAG: hypothetical protein AAF721_01695 [Myxococcota bacterium]